MPESPTENAYIFGISTIEYNLMAYHDPTQSTAHYSTRPFVKWVP